MPIDLYLGQGQTAANKITGPSDLVVMRGSEPTYWKSPNLGRRVRISMVSSLTDADLRVLETELELAAATSDMTLKDEPKGSDLRRRACFMNGLAKAYLKSCRIERDTRESTEFSIFCRMVREEIGEARCAVLIEAARGEARRGQN